MPEDKELPMDPMKPDDDIEIEFLDQEAENQEVEAEPEPEGLEPVPGPAVEEEAKHLKAELDHVRDIYLRKLAEFDNFRKRVEREREEIRLAGGSFCRCSITSSARYNTQRTTAAPSGRASK